MGPHEVTEFVVGAGWDDAGKTQFQVEASGTWDTLEQAMVASVCCVAQPKDYHLPEYVCRLIGLNV
jgi:hypothetical protein